MGAMGRPIVAHQRQERAREAHHIAHGVVATPRALLLWPLRRIYGTRFHTEGAQLQLPRKVPLRVEPKSYFGERCAKRDARLALPRRRPGTMMLWRHLAPRRSPRSQLKQQ